ncbi:MAG: fused DSP-PTPase phosphatase/NAD kinase-like protein, partial [Isosphaeraceae bacterium]
MTRDTSSPLDGDDKGNSESVLDHLPPLDLPSDVTEKTTTPPVQRKPQSPAPAPAPASDHLSGRSSREPDLTLTGTARPAPEPASSAGGAPGISRFVAVDLKLAAGSLPSAAGLDWLTEKGYKTLVDLRESSETDLPFIGEATKRGLRYIVLPVNLKSIDRAHVARFN